MRLKEKEGKEWKKGENGYREKVGSGGRESKEDEITNANLNQEQYTMSLLFSSPFHAI